MTDALRSLQQALLEASKDTLEINERIFKKFVKVHVRPELPSDDSEVFVFLQNGGIDVASYKGGNWHNKQKHVVIVKAWMKAPPVTGASGSVTKEDWEELEREIPNLLEKETTPKLGCKNTQLYPGERPIDYGHCQDILKDKYGEEKGKKYYDDLTSHPKAGAVHFVVATQIRKEKKRMLMDLGMYHGADSLDKDGYQTVKAAWVKKHPLKEEEGCEWPKETKFIDAEGSSVLFRDRDNRVIKRNKLGSPSEARMSAERLSRDFEKFKKLEREKAL